MQDDRHDGGFWNWNVDGVQLTDAAADETSYPSGAYVETPADEARDRRTFQVADHGVAPSPVPPAVPVSRTSRAARGRHVARHARVDDRFTMRDFFIWCGIPMIIVLLLRIFFFGFYEIPSRSMMDTIVPGDRVIAAKYAPKISGIKRGDIVVFKDPNNWLSAEQSNAIGGGFLIKRAIGLPGDVVACAGAGEPITINGVAINESSYIRPGVDPSAFPFSVTVSENHLFVLGDNRANSSDSRYHTDDGDSGLVPISDVVAVGLLTYWPLSRISVLDSHHEVFDKVPDFSSSGS
ncbi:signal peptidase I [Bifidobacterium olomucense]|uniref:Signal peptidase I n=1 Tax=Bifidobacterium olomucense TaxID=2675324 RepID=A0A7Y0F125_9BIFI|nr:signal peptidase I [Bifidobacterium sp. DSM 109959]NMM99071.1 signal peptidase I [Bifidobacterium sp. DSM 109959]